MLTVLDVLNIEHSKGQNSLSSAHVRFVDLIKKHSRRKTGERLHQKGIMLVAQHFECT